MVLYFLPWRSAACYHQMAFEHLERMSRCIFCVFIGVDLQALWLLGIRLFKQTTKSHHHNATTSNNYISRQSNCVVVVTINKRCLYLQVPMSNKCSPNGTTKLQSRKCICIFVT